MASRARWGLSAARKKELWERWKGSQQALRGCADRSWSAGRSTLPTVAHPALSDQPPHYDDHLGERHPEIDHTTPALRTPHQLLVRVVPGTRPLNHPPLRGCQRGRNVLAGDLADQPLLPESLAGDERVVAAIQVYARPIWQSPPTEPEARRRVGTGSGESLRLAGAVTASNGIPLASTAVERLMPCFPLSTGLLPALSPPQGAFVMHPSTATSANSRPI